MSQPHRWILRNEQALISLASGSIKMRESKRIFSQMLNRTLFNDDPSKDKAVRIATYHESIHFIQTFTTVSLFEYCEKVRSLTAEFAQWLQDAERDNQTLLRIANELNQVEDNMDRETGTDPIDGIGVSRRQLMEATAVIESLKAWNPDITIMEVSEAIPNHTDGGSLYGRVLGIGMRTLGLRAIELLPGIVFWALNSDDPGGVFCDLIAQISEASQIRQQDIILSFMQSMNSTLITEFAKGNRLSSSPFWNDIAIAYAQSGPIDVMHFAAAYPMHLLIQTSLSEHFKTKDIIDSVVPPLILFQDGTGSLVGRARSWTYDDMDGFLMINELTGALYRIAMTIEYENFCTHKDCPAWSLRLCHMAYPPDPPPNGSWHTCHFRSTFEEFTSMTPEELAAKYNLL
jgi:hypothetical protein